jgi:hypothetical protein
MDASFQIANVLFAGTTSFRHLMLLQVYPLT